MSRKNVVRCDVCGKEIHGSYFKIKKAKKYNTTLGFISHWDLCERCWNGITREITRRTDQDNE